MKKFLLFLLINLPILGYGQFVETFDGPSITSTNNWEGDLEDFKISSDGWLELVGNPDKKSSQINVLVPFSNNMEWSFDIKMDVKPTNFNHIRFYLLEHRPISLIDITDSYYIQVGSNTHTITLRRLRETEDSPKRLIEKAFDFLDSENVEVSIKIILENRSNWKLYVQEQGEKTYTLLGEYEDDITNNLESIRSGVAFHYSKNKRGHFIDNIHISSNVEEPEISEEPDSSSIKCTGILPLSPWEVQYEFSGPVSYEDASFYITGEEFEDNVIGEAKKFMDEEHTCVGVSFPEEMTIGNEYTFYWENVKDEKDLPIKDGKASGGLNIEEPEEDEEEKPEQPTPSGIIRINEVMANHKIEYIELYNTSNEDIILNGWMLTYGGDIGEYTLDGLTISANGYLVLYNSEYEWTLPEGTACPIDKFKQMNNKGKTFVLYHNAQEIDSYTYPEAEPGISWEYSETGWHLSSDERGGTPGEPNSEGKDEEEEEPEPDEPEKEDPEESEDPEEEEPEQPSGSFSSGDIRINEIMADPKNLEELPETEYIELYNTMDEEVQLKGWILQYGSTKVALDDVSIAAQGYMVLYRSGDEDFDLPSSSVCALDKFPANLNNDGKSFTLLYYTDVIDQYTYPKAKEGKSWEYAPEGWHVCSDPNGGTPGKANSDGIEEEEEEEQPDKPEEEEEPDQPELPSSPIELGAIRINEVMADPKGLEELPETEYIELYNVSDEALTLTGCTLVYDNRTKAVLDGISIPAHTFAVLYRSGREMSLISGIDCPVDKFPTLANAGEKSLVLYNHEGNIIDQYTYPKAKAGKSWEYAPEGWHLSSDPRGGTPGELNSDGIPEEEDDEEETEDEKEPEDPNLPHPTQGEIIINEILPEPFPDGSEYIELFNRSERDLSLADVCISTRKSDGSLNTIYPLSDYEELLESGGYLLISKSLDGVRAFYDVSDESHTLECKLPVLANTGASVVLYRISSKMIIDEVTYSPKWHSVPSSKRKGVALERINPAGASQSASNWTSAASVADYGTPGRPNSQYAEETDATGNESISIQKIQPSGPYAITYRLDKPGYSARGWVFDIIGRKTALLVDNESLGTAGTIEWNGHAFNGNPVEKGVYIMYLELWHPDGDILRKKAAFLVY